MEYYSHYKELKRWAHYILNYFTWNKCIARIYTPDDAVQDAYILLQEAEKPHNYSLFKKLITKAINKFNYAWKKQNPKHYEHMLSLGKKNRRKSVVLLSDSYIKSQLLKSKVKITKENIELRRKQITVTREKEYPHPSPAAYWRGCRCDGCKRAFSMWQKKHYAKNRKKILNSNKQSRIRSGYASDKRYYKKNRQKICSYRKSWYEKNKERILKKQKINYQNRKKEIN